MFWHQQTFEVTATDRATQFASPAFDVTVEELWPHLTSGACVYLFDEETRFDPLATRTWLLNCGITITILPTLLVENLIALEWPATTALRVMLTGGDTLYHYPPSTLPFAVINNYGPTETTVVASSGRIFPDEHATTPPSIGRPIANTQIYILDEHLQHVPTGRPGELYIGGAGLGKGYVNRPELTAEHFIPHPFCDEPEAYLYKTGDFARYLPDGQIAFMGRSDDQVKIRGYRIELDEIVAVLNEHPAIQTSLVVVREYPFTDKNLVAYIVLKPGEQVTVSALRDTLMTYLPDYMIPATFVQLEAFPLTSNGKVDRSALPAPNASNTIRDAVIVVPHTPLEAQLTEIMSTYLCKEQVGIDDDFFLLGGNSLLATQIIVHIAEIFGIELSIRRLFEASTVRQLAAEIEQHILAELETMSDKEVQELLQ